MICETSADSVCMLLPSQHITVLPYTNPFKCMSVLLGK